MITGKSIKLLRAIVWPLNILLCRNLFTWNSAQANEEALGVFVKEYCERFMDLQRKERSVDDGMMTDSISFSRMLIFQQFFMQIAWDGQVMCLDAHRMPQQTLWMEREQAEGCITLGLVVLKRMLEFGISRTGRRCPRIELSLDEAWQWSHVRLSQGNK